MPTRPIWRTLQVHSRKRLADVDGRCYLALCVYSLRNRFSTSRIAPYLLLIPSSVSAELPRYAIASGLAFPVLVDLSETLDTGRTAKGSWRKPSPLYCLPLFLPVLSVTASLRNPYQQIT